MPVHFATVVPSQASPGSATVLVSVTYGEAITRASQQFTVAATPFSAFAAPDDAVPAIQMVSVTVAALDSVTASPCVGGELGCSNPTPGYASMPFPIVALPLHNYVSVTWMLQDVSYAGPIEITVAFVQNGTVIGEPWHSTGISISGAGVSLLNEGSEVPRQALPGPTMIVVSTNYGGATTRASQTLTLQ